MMTVNKYFIPLFYFITFFVSISIAQNTEMDKIKINLNDNIIDTAEVNMLIRMSAAMYYENTTKSLEYAQKALESAKEINYTHGIALSTRYLGNCYGKTNDYKKSVQLYHESLEINRSIEDSNEMAKNLFGIGGIHQALGNFSTALDYFEKTISLKEQIKDKRFIAATLGNIAATLADCGKNQDAINFYLNSLDEIQEFGEDIHYAMFLSNISLTFSELNKPDSALKYSLKALNITQDLPVYKQQGSIYRQHGLIYEIKNDYINALKYYNKALFTDKENNNEKELAQDYFAIGYIYELQGKLADAFLFYSKALEYAKGVGAKSIMKDIFLNYYNLYQKQNNYKKALENYQLYVDVNQQIFDDETKIKIAQVTVQYETEKKEQEIIQKNNEIKLLEQEKRISNLKKLIIIIGLVLLLIAGTIMYIRLRRYSKEQKDTFSKEIKLKNTDLTNFALNIYNNYKFTENIKENIKRLKIKLKDKDLSKQLSHIENQIFIKLQVEKDKNEFQDKIKETYQSFYDKLTNVYSDLSNNDKQLAALLRLDLSSKEIANIFNISVKSVEMGRYRLRKRLNISRKDNLTELLKKI